MDVGGERVASDKKVCEEKATLFHQNDAVFLLKLKVIIQQDSPFHRLVMVSLSDKLSQLSKISWIVSRSKITQLW